MKVLVVLVLVAVARCADEPPKVGEKEVDGIKVFSRLIPADVLRDFPGLCFASTRCETIKPTESWSLAPFCGHSTCVPHSGRLFELVKDCGPLPKPNKKCFLDAENTNKTAEFPHCCPKFKCEDGAKLEYEFNPPQDDSSDEPEPSSKKP